MPLYTFSGPGDTYLRGRTTVEANSEAEARHLAMVARWGKPNNSPAKDTGADGQYLSAGLDLIKVEEPPSE